MIAVQQGEQEESKRVTGVYASDPWRALEREGATEQALNDLLGHFEEEFSMGTEIHTSDLDS
jgi:hypothetical protein